MRHGWKYGLIKVGYEGRGIEVLREPAPDGSEDDMICMLVELFPNDNGEYTLYGPANINTFWALEAAYRDVQRDGVNSWFFDHGAFEFRAETEEEQKGHGYQFFWKPFEPEWYKTVDPFSALIARIEAGEEKLYTFEEVLEHLNESRRQQEDGTGVDPHPVAKGVAEDH